MIALTLAGLGVLILCALVIDWAGRFSLDAAAVVYAVGIGGAVMALTAAWLPLLTN